MAYIIPSDVLMLPEQQMFSCDYIAFSDCPIAPCEPTAHTLLGGTTFFAETKKDQDGIRAFSVRSVDFPDEYNTDDLVERYLELAHECELRAHYN